MRMTRLGVDRAVDDAPWVRCDGGNRTLSGRMRDNRTGRHGFSMIELVIVVVIIGIVSAIAIPRLAGASDNSRVSTMKATLKILDTAAEMYAAEHDGMLPCCEPDGSVSTDGDGLIKR